MVESSIHHERAGRSTGSIVARRLVCGEQRYHREGNLGTGREILQRGAGGLEERKMQLQRLPKL